MIESEAVLGLPGYQITSVKEVSGRNRICAVYTGKVKCPHCGGSGLRTKDHRTRLLRHESWGERHNWLEQESRKYQWRNCDRRFWQRFPGILPRTRATEPYRRSVCRKHFDSISRSRLARFRAVRWSSAAARPRWRISSSASKASRR